MKVELDHDIADGWLVWRLWLAGKLPLSDFDKVSIDECEMAGRALDAWQAAEAAALAAARGAN